MTAPVLALRLQVGARTLASIPRRLVRVALSLDDVLVDRLPALPPLAGADGYLVTSLPEMLLPQIARDGLIAFVRQRYVRYHVDLTTGFDAWFAGLSANARTGLRRKERKLAPLDVRRFATPAEMAEFHPVARALSAITYQEKLLGSGLPDDGHSVRRMYALAGVDQVRAWLLYLSNQPIAYLWCSAQGTTLRYDFLGHDPAYASLSPGAVLQMSALRDLFAERRFARFDFLEGEGQHKRQFASGGAPCIDLLLLRPTIANRATIAIVGGFDRAMAAGKRLARHPALARAAKRARARS